MRLNLQELTRSQELDDGYARRHPTKEERAAERNRLARQSYGLDKVKHDRVLGKRPS